MQLDPELEMIVIGLENEDKTEKKEESVFFTEKNLQRDHKALEKELNSILTREQKVRNTLLIQTQGIIGRMKVWYKSAFGSPNDYGPSMGDILGKKNRKLGAKINELENIESKIVTQSELIFKYHLQLLDKQEEAYLNVEEAAKKKDLYHNSLAKLDHYLAEAKHGIAEKIRLQKARLRAFRKKELAINDWAHNGYKTTLIEFCKIELERKARHLVSVIREAGLVLVEARTIHDLVANTKDGYDALPQSFRKGLEIDSSLLDLYHTTSTYSAVVEELSRFAYRRTQNMLGPAGKYVR